MIHNAKFDAAFLWKSDVATMPQPMFDTKLANQVIGNRRSPRSLKEVAKEYLGQDLDKGPQSSDWSGDLTPEQIEYAAKDAQILVPLYETLGMCANAMSLEKVVDLENRTVPFIVWMETSGVPFDHSRWQNLSSQASKEADTLQENLNVMTLENLGENCPGTVNCNSASQVLKILKALGLVVDDTRQETLVDVANQHDLVPVLLRFREARKRQGTYGDKWARFIHQTTGRIHPNWKQIGGETGRMSCSKPSLHNLPRDKAYRECFRAEPGSVIIKADFSQIELRLAAEIAKDSAMIQAFQDGQDLHVLAASIITGKELDQVSSEDRQLAKAVNYGLIYGMSGKRLAEYAANDFGIPLSPKKAGQIRKRYFDKFPNLRKWHQAQSSLKQTRTILGKRREFGGESPYTKLLNSPVQGSGADGLKLAMSYLWERSGPVGAVPIMAVHDEIVVQVPADQAQEAEEWLIKAMVDGMKKYLTVVPVEVETNIKESW